MSTNRLLYPKGTGSANNLAPHQDNLLTALHRWAWRQDENFLTSALTHLLRYLLKNEAEIGIQLLSNLTSGRICVDVGDTGEVDVSMQVTTSLGRPDIQIRTREHLAFIEAKVESGLDQRG